MPFDKLAWSRAHRKSRGYDYRYEKTANGFLMRAYRNMLSRVRGLIKPHIYAGLAILPKQQFYAWAKADPTFWQLFRAWTVSRHNHKLSPSVNRIDTTQGYVIGNIEWVTHSVNSALGGMARNTREQHMLRRLLAQSE